MTAEELRRKVSTSAEALDTKMVNRLAVVEWWRPLAAVGAVIGALVAGLSRLFQDGELSVGLAVGGAVFASTCGAAIALMDRKKLEIGSEAKASVAVAEEVLNVLAERELELADEKQKYLKLTQDATAFDAKRNSRLQALRLMIDVTEAALLKNPKGSNCSQTTARPPRFGIARSYRLGGRRFSHSYDFPRWEG